MNKEKSMFIENIYKIYKTYNFYKTKWININTSFALLILRKPNPIFIFYNFLDALQFEKQSLDRL